MTLDMLATTPRPDGNRWSRNDQSRIAWKTGTSWGFRDAWTIGVVGHYVVAVWVGNFDGAGNPAFVGVQAAAPLFFRIADVIVARNPRMHGVATAPPRSIVKVDVCSASGDLPNAECPQTASTWFIPGVSPIRLSDVHRRVWIDLASVKQACPPFDTRRVRSEVYEFWPSDLQDLFAKAGMPRRAPPPRGDCDAAPRGNAPRISSPVANVTYALPLSSNEAAVPLAAIADGDVRQLHWVVDDAYVGTGSARESIAWDTPRTGRHLVRAIDDQGRADTREVNIEYRR